MSRCVAFLAGFCPKTLLITTSAALWRRRKRRRTRFGRDYPLIAAISGLVPMMFMTRVML